VKNTEIKSELSRELSLAHITLMGVGMMIGAGVFVATGIGIGIAGPGGILLAFALNGFLAFLSVMTYAELSSAIPKAGGGYAYVQHCIGGFPGFISGWISWFAHAVAGSLYAITFSKYTLHFIYELSELEFIETNLKIMEKVVALAVAIIFLYVNYRGASETGSIGAIITVGQTAVLAIIGLIGIYVAIRNPERLENFTPFLPGGWGKVLVVMGFSLVGYEGYEVITNTSEEAIDAKKNVPKAIFLAVIIVITTYLLVGFAAVIAVSNNDLSLQEWFRQYGATGFAEAIGQLFPFGNVLVVLAAIFASTSALNATIYSSTRVAFSLGRDGYLPEIIGSISPRRRIPQYALLFSGIIILTVAALLPVEVVMAGSSIFFIILFSMVTFTVIKVRKEQGDELQYGYLIPYFPIIPIISICGMLTIGIFLFDMGALAYIIAGSWLFMGILLYLIYGRKRAVIGEDSRIFIGEGKEQQKTDSIMISVGNPKNIPLLMKYASLLRNEQSQNLILSNIITVPYQTPVREAGKFLGSNKVLMENYIRNCEESNQIQGVIKMGHNIGRSIISSVRETGPQLLIMGWSGHVSKGSYTMGSTLDPVIELAAADLLIIKPGLDEPQQKITKILFPSRGKSPHSRLAHQIINNIADKLGADVTFFHVYQCNKKNKNPSVESKVLKGDFHNSIHTIKIVEHCDVVKAIIDESKKYDLVVLGASENKRLKRFLYGTIPEKIAANCSKTVLLIKQNRGIRPWIRRWFF